MKIKGLLDDQPQPQEQQKVDVQIIQPWSNIILKVKIPDPVFEQLQKVYDYTMKDWTSFGHQLVGAVDEEPEVTMEIQNKFPEWIEWCLQATKNFVVMQTQQNLVHDKERLNEVMNDEIMAKMQTMWFVNQKPHEYNPIHVHTNCRVSSVCYLKTPKKQIRDRKSHYKSDGMITFVNNSGSDTTFSNSTCSFEPKAGDMYLFGSFQHHMVWPYRSTDPDDLRVSLSFNADVTTRSLLDKQAGEQKKSYEKMKEYEEKHGSLNFNPKNRKVKDDKSVTDGNINKSG